jgi:glycosyltransferase involved in cell wall biosynthesis
MITPTLSIITACYNDLSALKRTLNSVKNQRFKLSHIVIDAASNDGTQKLLADIKLNNDNFTYLSESDNGVYDAINKGIALAKSEYILILNAGDTFAKPHVVATIFSSKYFFNQDYLVGRVRYLYSSGNTKNDSPFFYSEYNLECSHQAFLYKKDLHTKLGLYDLSYQSAADYDFFSKIYRDIGLLQTQKFPITIAVREKFGRDMSDTLKHSFEMIRIDMVYGFLRKTFFQRIKELAIKTLKLLRV